MHTAAGSTGAMGGLRSHEFLLPSDVGEDPLCRCERCGGAWNLELLVGDAGAEQKSAHQIRSSASASLHCPRAECERAALTQSRAHAEPRSRGTRDHLNLILTHTSWQLATGCWLSLICTCLSTCCLQVAHAFLLGTRYSKALGAHLHSSNNKHTYGLLIISFSCVCCLFVLSLELIEKNYMRVL